MAGLPPDWVTSASAPLLVEYCRHLIYARQAADHLAQMRGKSLFGAKGFTGGAGDDDDDDDSGPATM